MSSNKKRRSSTIEDDSNMEDAGKRHSEKLYKDLTGAAATAQALSRQRSQSARVKFAEASRLEIQAKDLKDQAIAIKASAVRDKHQAQSLHFQAIQAGLESNNSAILTTVNSSEGGGLSYPDGYGAALGRALSKNTVVTDLKLDLDNFLSDDTITVIGESVRDYAKWQAAVQNEMKPLLHFMANNPSLQRCTVRCDDDEKRELFGYVTTPMSDWVMQKLSQSSSLTELSWYANLSTSELRDFMVSSSKTLRRFTIKLDLENDDEAVAEAFGNHQALQHLTLRHTTWEDGFVGRILHKLHGAKRLQSLRLVSEEPLEKRDETFFRSLSRYLQKSSASGNTPLERLEMDQFDFVDANMRTLLEGLVCDYSNVNGSGGDRGSRPSSSIAISMLLLTNCSWSDPNAHKRLTNFLQRRTTNEGAMKIDSKLRAVHVGCNEGSSLGPLFSRRLASSLLGKKGSNTDGKVELYPTVGSQLTALGLENVDPDFFSYLSNHVDRARSSRLKRFHLRGMSKEASRAFAEGLPKLTMIRKLSLQQVAKGAATHILQGLKSNSSVVNVTTSTTSGFDAAQERKIQAYCRRNQELRSLIESEALTTGSKDGSSGSSSASRTATGPHDSSTASIETRTDTFATAESSGRLLVYPAVLQVAQQVPSTQEGMLLRGLLSLGPSGGPLSSLPSPPPQSRDAKRCSTSKQSRRTAKRARNRRNRAKRLRTE